MAGVEDGRNGLVVAVVDDDQAVGDSLAFLLETAGYRAITFPSAAAFLNDREIRPAHLIVDHGMPDMTGLQLAERLHREGDSKIPFLLITGAPTPAIVSGAAKFGVRAVLTKPFEPDELLAIVAASLGASER